MGNNSCINCNIKSKAAQSLSIAELEKMGDNCSVVSFKKGETIIKEGTFASNVIYIKSGLVKIHMKGPRREMILRIIKAPSYLGIPSLFADKVNLYSVTAIEDVKACYITFDAFREFILNNGRFAIEIISDLCRNEIKDYQRWVSQSQKNTNGRLAETLCCLSNNIFDNNTFTLPLTQGELGDLTSITRESVCRILNELSEDGIIELKRKKIRILNKEILHKISLNG
jgi:CRP/FNR family transcriptional regulator